MGKGKVLITNDLIAKSLQFPADWSIDVIIPSKKGVSEMLITGSDFPSVDGNGDAKKVELICHKEALTYEVKKLS